jgi:hypothetical protein
MTGFFKNYKLLFIVTIFLLVASCISKNKTSELKVNWCDYLIEQRNWYLQNAKGKEVSEIKKEFQEAYPWHWHKILSKIKPAQRNSWFEGKNDDLGIDKLLKKLEAEQLNYTNVFQKKLNQSENEGLKFKLLLVEEIMLFQDAIAEFQSLSFNGLENAISDIQIKYPNKYNGEKFKSKIEDLKQEHLHVEQSLAAPDYSVIKDLIAFNGKYKALQRKALLANPLVKDASIVFVTRKQYLKDHHNSATLFHTNEINTHKYTPGGSMKIIDLKKGGAIKTLIETTEGVARDPEISYDGKKILFSMRNNIEEDYHIYEMDIDGSNMKQLTAAKGVADIDPQYLPSGDIVFTSTREPKYCMCNVHIMGNIFKMQADGANITQLGKSTLFEGHSTIMPDGRILYDRWEYIDRNFGDAQGLWTMNPDGTNQAVYFGNNTNSPGGYIDARPIPGTDKVIAVMGSCHDRPWGALGIINRNKGVDGKASIERTWPKSAIELVGKGDWDTFLSVRPLYEDPYPLSDTYFLCSRTIDASEQMGLFLIDTFGNEVLIHTEAPGCYDPVVIKPRQKEFAIKEKRNFKSEAGKFYVQDVYQGTHMKGVKRGSVKYLRVIESIEKRSWTKPAWKGQGVHRPAMNWHSFECKKILGTVPVQEDGSVYFEVPADRYVFFQLLDENKMMIQSMRSGTMVHSGEVSGCIGCHDDRRMAPSSFASKMPEALKLPPSKLTGWYGEARNFGFMKEVQPVFTKHCVECHDFGKKAGKHLILSADRNPYFNASYIDMHMKNVIKPVGAGPAEIQEAYSWGAHPSKLVKMIKNGHAGVKLSKEEMERIVTWVDMNAVYYSDFISAYPDNPVGRSPISEEDLSRLGKLTGVNFNGLNSFKRKLRPQISFERPEMSPCLQNIKNKNTEEYKEALAIIEKGKKELNKLPRLDMNGFIPSKVDQERLNKYLLRQNEEIKNREAIRNGSKYYDEGIHTTN